MFHHLLRRAGIERPEPLTPADRSPLKCSAAIAHDSFQPSPHHFISASKAPPISATSHSSADNPAANAPAKLDSPLVTLSKKADRSQDPHSTHQASPRRSATHESTLPTPHQPPNAPSERNRSSERPVAARASAPSTRSFSFDRASNECDNRNRTTGS